MPGLRHGKNHVPSSYRAAAFTNPHLKGGGERLRSLTRRDDKPCPPQSHGIGAAEARNSA
jgi:hypothetical protein